MLNLDWPNRSSRLHWLAYACLLLVTACQSDAKPLPETESWGVLLVDGKKIGYQHFKRSHAKTPSGVQVKVESTEEIRIRRFGSETVMRVEQSANETAGGTLIDFEMRMKSGSGIQTTTGEVSGDKLTIRQGERPATTLPVPEGVGSFAALDSSLQRTPLEPGEKRKIHQIEASLGGVATIELEAKDWESTELLSGAFRLLRIEGKMQMPGGVSLPLVMWTNTEGDTLKAIVTIGGLKQSMYRTTKEIALAPSKGKAFDLGKVSTVPVKRGVAGMHEKKSARYRVRLKIDADGSEFASGSGQSIKKIDTHTLELTVHPVRPGEGSAVDNDRPTDADRTASGLIENDDATIIAMAKKAGGDSDDAWTTAKKLERHVYQAIRKKNFSSAFDSAATVAKTLSGDCTEHAVLLAALARAKKIPARVAVGLVYMNGANAFGMHMWTEVWIDDRWVGLDATLGRGGLGAGHIKIAHSNLNGPGAYSSFLPVANLLGRMEIEVLEVQ